MKNIILIGMMGCGKTTVGKKISERTGLPFYDADDVFTEHFGTTPAEVICNKGEAEFRGMETQILAELTKRSGCIIATGGGAVKREENRTLMKQNGYVAYIERAIGKLATNGRPLSYGGTETLKKLFDERDALYKAVADKCFPTEEDPDRCAEKIVQYFGFERQNS